MLNKEKLIVEQGREVLPLETDKQRRRRELAEAVWRPLTLLIWLLQAVLIFLLVRGVQDIGVDSYSLVPTLFICWQAVLLVTGIFEEAWRFCIWTPVKLKRRTRLVGEEVPLVDIIIVCCGEETAVILDTVRAACVQDYVPSQYRVLISDDGNSDEIKRAIMALRKVVPCQLLYYRRPGKPGSKRGYKAGNMNAALEFLDLHTRGKRTEFCAFLDCDMIIEQDFLRACLGHLLLDQGAGVVIVPQNFYNVPSNDPLYQSMHVFNILDQIQRDGLDSAWETGPGVIFRRQAIIDMGGFNEWVLMEDAIAGMLLNGLGWKTVYCFEKLQWGLVPEDFAAHVAQRRKWVVGNIRGAMIAAFGFHRSKLARLEYWQRTVQTLYYFGPFVSVIRRTLLPITFLALVASRSALVVPNEPQSLDRMLLLGFLIGLGYRAQTIVTGYQCGYRMSRRRTQGATWLSPYLFQTILREFLPSALAGMPMRFVPSGRLNSNLQERDRSRRAPTWRRVVVMVMHQGLWYHAMVGSVAFGLAYLEFARARAQPDRSAMCRYLWTHALAPGVDWLVYLELAAPLSYAWAPPNVPARKDLLQKSTINEVEVWRPKVSSRSEEWTWYSLLWELSWIVAYASCLVLRKEFCSSRYA